MKRLTNLLSVVMIILTISSCTSQNDFERGKQQLEQQGYYRDHGYGAWMKDGEVVSGKELNNKLNEYKNGNLN